MESPGSLEPCADRPSGLRRLGENPSNSECQRIFGVTAPSKALGEIISDSNPAFTVVAVLYQQPAGLTGMRAGLVWRLRAKSMRYQRPDNRTMSQESGPLVLAGRRSHALPRRQNPWLPRI